MLHFVQHDNLTNVLQFGGTIFMQLYLGSVAAGLVGWTNETKAQIP